MWLILSYWTGLHYRWKRGTNWTWLGWWTYLFYVADFILLNRATLQMKEGYKLNMVRMMDLSVLCDKCYPIEQGYTTDERGVQIEQGSDDGYICSMWQILSYWTGLHYSYSNCCKLLLNEVDALYFCLLFEILPFLRDKRSWHVVTELTFGNGVDIENNSTWNIVFSSL